MSNSCRFDMLCRCKLGGRDGIYRKLTRSSMVENSIPSFISTSMASLGDDISNDVEWGKIPGDSHDILARHSWHFSGHGRHMHPVLTVFGRDDLHDLALDSWQSRPLI